MANMTFTFGGRKYVYEPIPESKVPADIRFDVPAQYQGQVVEYAFGTTSGGEADVGDPFLRRTDGSTIQGRSNPECFRLK